MSLNVSHSTIPHLSLTNSSCLLHLQSESLNMPSYLHYLWQLLKLTLMFRSQQLTYFLYFMFKCLAKFVSLGLLAPFTYTDLEVSEYPSLFPIIPKAKRYEAITPSKPKLHRFADLIDCLSSPPLTVNIKLSKAGTISSFGNSLY